MSLSGHPFPAEFLLRAAAHARQEQAVLDGFAAIVRAYYENYTDATELEPGFIGALFNVARYIELDEDDLRETVVATERAINEDGGIEGTEGRHKVGPTFEIEDEDD